jgi:DNA-binding CsgD family transcriptional regulator
VTAGTPVRTALVCTSRGPAQVLSAELARAGLNGVVRVADSPQRAAGQYRNCPVDVLIVDNGFSDPTRALGKLRRATTSLIVLDTGTGADAARLLRAVLEAVTGTGLRPRPDTIRPAALTGREQAVLVAMADGLHNREIAERLGISLDTVKTHASHVYNKLGARYRADAIARALRTGLLR